MGNPAGRAGIRKSSRASGGRSAGRSNPGHIIGYMLGNPGGKKGPMAKTKKHHKKSTPGYKPHKANPAGKKHDKGVKHHRRRGNPGMLTNIGGRVSLAAFVIVGALGSKLGAQAVLGAKNTGTMGYLGNAGAGLALWLIAEKVMKNRTAADGIAAGTLVQIILRVINDLTPFGSYVNQLGMGDYQMQSFVTPQVLVDPMNSAEISIPSGWAPKMLPAPAPAAAGAPGMSGLYGGGRFGGNLYGV